MGEKKRRLWVWVLIGAILGGFWGASSYLAGYLPIPTVLNFFLGIPLLISVYVTKLIFTGENLFFLFIPIPVGIIIGIAFFILLFYLTIKVKMK